MTTFFKTYPFPDHLIARIDHRVWQFLNLCAANDIDARLVGGSVRDALSGIKEEKVDYDSAVACPPDDVIAFCLKHNIKYFPTGIEHGTITIRYKGITLEVTSLRSDVKTHGRHATVVFSASFEEDAKRRDFTFNALYVDHNHILYDAFNGQCDLKNSYVRFIGNAHTRIKEDYLRLYRYFRFWGKFGRRPVDLTVLPALNDIKEGLSCLSIERIQSELFKILALKWPGPILESMCTYGVLNHLFGAEIDFKTGIKNMRRLVLCEHFGKHPVCIIRRLVALTSTDVSHVLKLTRLDQKKMKALITHVEPNDMALNKPEFYIDAMLLTYARSTKNILKIKTEAENITSLPDFPLAGKDLIAHGIPAGKKIGEVLKKIKKSWIENGCTWDKKMALKVLDRLLQSIK